MKKGVTIFLQILLVIIGLSILVLLLWLPLTEGRAVHLSVFQIYADPFILYGYAAAVVFYIGLYNAFRLLSTIRSEVLNPNRALKFLQNIKHSAVLLSFLIITAAVLIRIFHDEKDDPAGFIALCMLCTLATIVVAVAAMKWEKSLKKSANRTFESNTH